MAHPVISIVMGSDSDASIVEGAIDILKKFGVAYDVNVISAHRSPERALEFAKNARKRGVKAIIACAGSAAHLAGVLASHTTVPVIGIPVPSSDLKGLDALLATVQMPAGVPVATMAIGRSGASNGAVLAVQMLALTDGDLCKKLEEYKRELARKVEDADKKIKEKIR
jgi:phosphoribosylamine--glycine ligase